MGLRLAGVFEGVPDTSSLAAAENSLICHLSLLIFVDNQSDIHIALSENKRPGKLVKRVWKDLINVSKGDKVREEELEKRGKDLAEHVYL